jgi:4-azaleucine resistance transporter AzlC
MKKKLKLKKIFQIALKLSMPIFMGYTILGFSFGFLFVSFKYPWQYAILISIFVYAGALQFVMINFLNTKATLINIFFISLLVNIRQIFYGLPLLKQYNKPSPFKWYLIFALTDEVYALITSLKKKKNINRKFYYLFLSLLCQGYWILGVSLGVVLGSNVVLNLNGLDFSLTALFVVLAIEQYKNIKNTTPFVLASIASIISLIFIPSEQMLIVAIGLSLLSMFIFKSKLENTNADKY